MTEAELDMPLHHDEALMQAESVTIRNFAQWSITVEQDIYSRGPTHWYGEFVAHKNEIPKRDPFTLTLGSRAYGGVFSGQVHITILEPFLPIDSDWYRVHFRGIDPCEFQYA